MKLEKLYKFLVPLYRGRARDTDYGRKRLIFRVERIRGNVASRVLLINVRK